MRTIIDFLCGITLLTAIVIAGDAVLYKDVTLQQLMLSGLVAIVALIAMGFASARINFWWTFWWMPILVITYPIGIPLYWFAFLRKKITD